VPSVSKKQHNFMAAVANNPEFAKKAGVPQSVGKEFSNADKGRKFSKGGDMKSEAMKKGGMPMKMKDGKKVPIFMNKGGATGMGKVKTAAPSKDGVATKGKTKGTMIAMAKGGKAMKSGGKTC
jgi:hypothetical protein